MSQTFQNGELSLEEPRSPLVKSTVILIGASALVGGILTNESGAHGIEVGVALGATAGVGISAVIHYLQYKLAKLVDAITDIVAQD